MDQEENKLLDLQKKQVERTSLQERVNDSLPIPDWNIDPIEGITYNKRSLRMIMSEFPFE